MDKYMGISAGAAETAGRSWGARLQLCYLGALYAALPASRMGGD